MVLDYDEFETVILVLAYHMYNLQKRTELSFEEYLGEVRCRRTCAAEELAQKNCLKVAEAQTTEGQSSSDIETSTQLRTMIRPETSKITTCWEPKSSTRKHSKDAAAPSHHLIMLTDKTLCRSWTKCSEALESWLTFRR